MSTRKPVRIVHPEHQVAAVVIGFFLVYGAGISVALTASTAVAGGITAAALIAVAFLNSGLRLRAATARTA